MGKVRHGSATTTHAVRAAIQRSQASLSQPVRKLSINLKTGCEMAEAGQRERLSIELKGMRAVVVNADRKLTHFGASRRLKPDPTADCPGWG